MAERRPPRSGPRGAPRCRQRPSQRARRADPARQVAYELLRAVHEGAYANLELPRRLRRAGLSGRDAGFATELGYGTLRQQGLYDRVVAQAARRPTGQIDPPVLDVLRLGCHQLLATRVPPHAAVSATVALARQHVGSGAAGFTNAVLRRVAEHDLEGWRERVTEGLTDPLERLAVVHSHPGWVVRALRAALLEHGETEDALPGLLAAHNRPGALTLAARPGLAAEDELASAGATADPVCPTAWRLPDGDPARIAAVREGRAAVQDAGSQLLTLALLAAPVEGRDEHWLDLCAGPGGKAGLLAGAAIEAGARLRANEISEHRARLVEQTLAAARAAGAQLEVTVGDGREVGEAEPGHYDRVLVDAPCTGLGALRRRPEARWRRQPEDLTALAPLQRALLESAVAAVRPGGVVAYATCSPHLAETRFVVQDVLRRDPGLALEDVRRLLRDRAGEALPATGQGEPPWAQLWPHRHDTDGMFVALLRRRAAEDDRATTTVASPPRSQQPRTSGGPPADE